PIAGEDARPKPSALEHAVRVAMVGDLEKPTVHARAHHATRLGKLARIRGDRAVVLDPARGHADGQARAVTLEPIEHGPPVAPAARTTDSSGRGRSGVSVSTRPVGRPRARRYQRASAFGMRGTQKSL